MVVPPLLWHGMAAQMLTIISPVLELCLALQVAPLRLPVPMLAITHG